MALFGDQFSRKSGKRQWRYVALCGAIFWTLENDSKMPNMKGINTYGTFGGSIFNKTRKTAVALCGAIFWTLEKRLKNAKYERNQYIWHFLGINFQENPENGSGAMWRYVALFFGHWKTIKKCQI